MDWKYWLRTRPSVLIRGGALGLFFMLVGALMMFAGGMMDPMVASSQGLTLSTHSPHVMAWLSYFGLFGGFVFLATGFAIVMASIFFTPERMRQFVASLFKRLP